MVFVLLKKIKEYKTTANVNMILNQLGRSVWISIYGKTRVAIADNIGELFYKYK